MLTRQNVLRLLLLGLLLAALLVPVVGMSVAGNVAGALDDAPFQRLIQGDGPTGQPAAIIACDDPGGSGGSGGGC